MLSIDPFFYNAFDKRSISLGWGDRYTPNGCRIRATYTPSSRATFTPSKPATLFLESLQCNAHILVLLEHRLKKLI